MKKILIPVLCMLLSACNSNTGADGYKFGKKEFEKKTFQVVLVTYPSDKEFQNDLKNRNLPVDTVAFSELRPPYDVCVIHIVDPAVKYEPEYYGHELMHCAYGQFHTDNNSFQ